MNASYYRGQRLESGKYFRSGSALMPRLARIDPDLHIPSHRERSADLVKESLTEAAVPYWILPSRSNKPSIIGVDSRYRETVFSALARGLHFRCWYIQELSHRGTAYGTVRIVGNSLKPMAKAAGLRLYEFVQANKESSFTSNPSQGVEIHFWTEEEGVFRSGVWNDRVVEITATQANTPSSSQIAAAVSPAIQDVTFPVDVVYTWVDGADPNWLAQKAAALQLHDPNLFTDRAIDAARFEDHDELRFSLRSIEQNAPWVRKIWIVTAGQVPTWLDTANERISVVDHEEIWPSPEGLPNFNSHAIEANLHRIPGLATHYLYFNDDVFLGRPLTADHFFHPNGITKFFHSRAMVDFGPIVPGENASTTAAKNARQLIEQDFGLTFSRKFYHAPAPISREIMNRAEAQFPEAFQRTREASFRQATDIAASGSMYFNYAYATGSAVPGSIRYDYIDPASDNGRTRLENVIRRRQLDVICINDGATEQSLSEREETDRYLRDALSRLYPVKASFEL